MLLPTEFTYPASWLGDQTVAERAARRAEEARARDLPPLSGPARSRAARRTNVYEPVAAYGPPGGRWGLFGYCLCGFV